MGKSLNVFSRDARSVISGRDGFFLRAFSYSGDCSARRARLTLRRQKLVICQGPAPNELRASLVANTTYP